MMLLEHGMKAIVLSYWAKSLIIRTDLNLKHKSYLFFIKSDVRDIL